jgi:hypothetical protein
LPLKARRGWGIRPISSLEFATLDFVPVCAFCPSTANLTGEHIWPAWLSKLLPKTRHKNERINGEAKTTWTTTRLDQTANVVCKTCNETWMSDLEQKAKGLLTDVILNGKQTAFGVEDMKFLAAYAFKNAVIANYQTLRLVPETISTRAQRERFGTSLALPSDIRIWVSSFQGHARYSGRSNPRYAKSTNDPAPLDDIDIFTHTYVVGHLVFQVLAYRFNSILNRGLRIELPKQTEVWNQACQQIWPTEASTIIWPAKYLGPRTIEAFVDRWFGQIPITLISGRVGQPPE